MNLVSTKVSENFFIFLKRFRANRIKSDNADEPESIGVLTELIFQFFRKNPDQYLKLLKEQRGVNNGRE